jgi:hypothetical protein
MTALWRSFTGTLAATKIPFRSVLVLLHNRCFKPHLDETEYLTITDAFGYRCHEVGVGNGIEQAVVTEQIAGYVAQCMTCPHCGAQRTRKGHPPIIYRTLFGNLSLTSPRLYDCSCMNRGRHSSSPLAQLLTMHCAPELLYLEIL